MKTKLLIGGVILLLIIGLTVVNKANASDGVRLSLGQTVSNSTIPYMEISLEREGWQYGYRLIGEGHTESGDQETTDAFSVVRMIRPPKWKIFGLCDAFLFAGVSYVSKTPLVGKQNYRIGGGCDFNQIVALKYSHDSSANIHKDNRGLDGISLDFKLSF